MLARVIFVGCFCVASATLSIGNVQCFKTPGKLSAPRDRPTIGKLSAFVSSSIRLRSHRASAKCPTGHRGGLLSAHCSLLVTYGDIWRNTLEELPQKPTDTQLNENQLNLTIDDKFVPEHPGVSITGVETMETEFEVVEQKGSLHSVVRPVKKAATVMGAAAACAASNLWSSLTQGPSDDEVNFFFRGRNFRHFLSLPALQAQENLRKWAKAKGGAVLPPLEEEELDNQVPHPLSQAPAPGSPPHNTHPPAAARAGPHARGAAAAGALRGALPGAGGPDDGDDPRGGRPLGRGRRRRRLSRPRRLAPFAAARRRRRLYIDLPTPVHVPLPPHFDIVQL